jgi:hypothetical protein
MSDNVFPTKGGGNAEGQFIPSAELELNNFVNMVRMFMRDHAELNRLVAGEESSNRQILWAVMDALDDFNSDPPFTSYGIYSFPSRSLLVRMTAISLLTSIGLLQTRNHLQFSDGGITVGINDKTPFLQAWINLLTGMVKEKKDRIKVAQNIERAWDGGVNSEYRFVNNFYGEW